MSVRVHPRLLRRRAKVREHRARRHLRRMLGALGVIAVVAVLAWVAQSPLFSVNTVRVEGGVAADYDAILERSDVYEGRPLLLINTGRVETALEADPWVKSAFVSRRFPTTVDVELEERYEVAALATGSAWITISDDGHAMRELPSMPEGLGVVRATASVDTIRKALNEGGALGDEALVAAAEFLAALPERLLATSEVVVEGEQLWAGVDGHPVRLGAAVDAAAKGLALTAVLEDGQVAAGEIVDLIAPTRPAVRAPTPPPPEPSPEPEGSPPG